MDLTLYAEPTKRAPRHDPSKCITKGCDAAPVRELRCQPCYNTIRAGWKRRHENRRKTARKWTDKPNQCPRCTTATDGGLCPAHLATLAELQNEPGYLDITELDNEDVVIAVRSHQLACARRRGLINGLQSNR